MPLNCNGLHNWFDPYFTRERRGNITLVKLVQTCANCQESREVYHPAPRLPVSERIQSYEIS